MFLENLADACLFRPLLQLGFALEVQLPGPGLLFLQELLGEQGVFIDRWW